jgi:preprotein translocase subunit SecE
VGMKEVKNFFGRSKQFLFNDVPAEMKKVSWPGKDTVYSSTKAVIISTVVLSLYISFFDAIFKYLLEVTAK